MIYGQAKTLLKEKRIEMKMTQGDVCRELNMPRSTYSAIETGFLNPNPNIRKKLDDLFDLPLDYWDSDKKEA